MVIYNLLCKKKHSFEGWFPSFEDFQKQADKKLISCPTCGTTKVEKVPHACAVHVKKEQPAPPAKKPEQTPPAPPSAAEFKEMLLKVHHYVKENFEDVGTRFAEEGVPFVALPKPELDS